MNLFQSEEHIKSWALYDPQSADGTMLLGDYAALFRERLFKERLEPDYLLRQEELTADQVANWTAALARLDKAGPFWSFP